MEKVTLNKITKYTNDKAGNLLKTKDGRPYTRINIQTKEYGDKWMSGFQGKENESWKEGDIVEIIKKQNGEYLNFDTPKKDDKVVEMLSELLTKVGRLNANIEYLKDKLIPQEKQDTSAVDPESGIDLNDNPPF